MDLANLTAKYDEYEASVSQMLELVDVFKDECQKSKENIVTKIEDAGVKAVERLNILKAELIKDTVSHINSQIRDYEIYEDGLSSSLLDVKETMQEAMTNPQYIRETTIKMNKARYALEKPAQKVVSFIEQWAEGVSKADIGMVVVDVVQEEKTVSTAEKKPVKKKLQKHEVVRKPNSLKTVTPTNTKSQYAVPQTGRKYSSSSSTPEVKRTKMGPPTHGSFLTSTIINAETDRTDSSTVDDSILNGPSSDEVDLIISAVNEWSIINKESPNVSAIIESHCSAPNKTLDEELEKADVKIPDSNPSDTIKEFSAPCTKPDPAPNISHPPPIQSGQEEEEVWGKEETTTDDQWIVVDETGADSSRGTGVDPLIVPSISIDFSTLSITEAKTESKPIKPEPFLPALPAASTALDSRTFGSDISNTNQSTVNFGVRGDSMRPGNGSGDSKPAQVKMEKDIRSASAITKFLSRGGSTEVMHAKLSNAVGGRVLDLKFPIGACVYNDGLVVCNSGDNTVLYFQYKNDGSIPNKTYIQGRFQRPSAVVVDQTGSLFIKDDTCIRRYGTKLTLEKMFPECARRPYGLALTDNNTLVTMCDCGNGRGVPANPCLMEYDINGTVLHKIKLQLPLHVSTKLRFMDVYGDSIYISDLGASHVYKVDRHAGTLIKTIAQPGRQPGTFNEPSGITCDKDGNILIGDSRSNRIQIFDGKEGVFKAILTCQGGLTRPSGIYLAPDDKLYVVNYLAHRVQIYDLQV